MSQLGILPFPARPSRPIRPVPGPARIPQCALWALMSHNSKKPPLSTSKAQPILGARVPTSPAMVSPPPPAFPPILLVISSERPTLLVHNPYSFDGPSFVFCPVPTLTHLALIPVLQGVALPTASRPVSRPLLLSTAHNPGPL